MRAIFRFFLSALICFIEVSNILIVWPNKIINWCLVHENVQNWIKKENNKKLLIIIENLNKSCNLSITYVKFESVTFDQIFMFVELKCQCNKKNFWI